VLESGEIRRVGENEPLTVDVRVVCATHRQLEEMVASGDFREDLLFRINTFEIPLPPLRQRIEDIGPLARHLLARSRPHIRPDDEVFSPEAMELLKSHNWPGNIRELANVVEHAAILCDTLPITVDNLPDRLNSNRPRQPQFNAAGRLSLREIEMQAIRHSLDRNAGSKPKTAEELGISLKTLYNKLHQEAELERSA
jgi:DNA-binding NtrC family response regulator